MSNPKTALRKKALKKALFPMVMVLISYITFATMITLFVIFETKGSYTLQLSIMWCISIVLGLFGSGTVYAIEMDELKTKKKSRSSVGGKDHVGLPTLLVDYFTSDLF